MSGGGVAMRSLYLEPRRWLHAVPAWIKLAVLSVSGVVLFACPALWVAGKAAALAALLLVTLGAPAWRAIPAKRGLAVAILLVVLANGALGAWRDGLAAALRLFALTAAGLALVMTTRFDDLLGAVTALLEPLRRVGLRPERLALGFGLMLRFVEVFFVQWQRLDDAHRMRTGRAGGLRLLPPLVLHVLAASERVGDALAARLGR